MHGEKVRWEALNNAKRCFEQIMEVVPNKSAAVQPIISNLTTHFSKSLCRHKMPSRGPATHSVRESKDSVYLYVLMMMID